MRERERERLIRACVYGAGQSCMLYPRQGSRHIHHHSGAEGAPVQQGGSALQHHTGGAGRSVLVVKTTSFVVVAKHTGIWVLCMLPGLALILLFCFGLKRTWM